MRTNLLPFHLSAFFGLTFALVTLRVQAAPDAPEVQYRKLSWTQMIENPVACAALPLPLSDVRLTGGPLKLAQDLDAAYLLELDPDRILYYLQLRAGLKPKAKEGYGGWDGAGRQLTGHIAGHYLSAVSYMYAATGDPRFKSRADYMVKALKEIEEKQGDGYIGALLGTPRGSGGTNLVDGKILFNRLAEGTIQSGGFDLNGMWSPWYVEHKLFAGLRDAYRLTGNTSALEVEMQFARWIDDLLSKLSPPQIQRMLATEFGGMNEVMADLYADTGDPRWLRACDYFEHQAIVYPLAQQKDILGGKHGNTQVPKLLGELKRYVYTGNVTNGAAAQFFWDQVVYHHSFATGGHGYDEYFGAPDKLSGQVDGSGQRSHDLRTCESCNVYNMEKMTRVLFSLHPKETYAAFLERALFNHVLASINFNDGRTCYMVPIGQGVAHEYQDMSDDFTCCVGTGMENHGLHGDGIYYESGDKLWVNLYAPSIANWRRLGVKVFLDTGFPEANWAVIRIASESPRRFTLALRRPAWAGAGFTVSVNGKPVANIPDAGSYVEINRNWKPNDYVKLTLPKTLHEEALPDNSNRVALMWGPLVLAADFGPANDGGRSGRNPQGSLVFVTGDRSLEEWLQPGETNGVFIAYAAGTNASPIRFQPFYQLSSRRYGIYCDVFTRAEWSRKSGTYTGNQENAAKLAAATVAYAQPGEMQPERDYKFQGEDSSPVRVMEQAGRRGSKWFSFDLPVDPSHPMTLVVTYNSDEAQRRTFDILVDGQRVGQQSVEKSTPARFFDVEYPLPAGLVRNKQNVTVRFQASNGNEIASVFGIRMIRSDAER